MKKSITHPNIIGWVKWCNLLKIDSRNRKLILEIVYNNKKIDNFEKRELNKLIHLLSQ